MDDRARPRPEAVTPLRDAIRRARIDDAERSGAIADLRAAELARLEILRDALAPIFSEVPEDAELFDHGLVPGEHPRLFVDILAFVEMGQDRRQYRFVQDSRWGQRVMLESDDIQAVIRAVTDYVALRLVERRKALASDGIAGRLINAPTPPAAQPAPAKAATPMPELRQPAAQPAPMPTPPASTAKAEPVQRVSPIVVFALGIAAGIAVTLLVGLLRARGLIAF
jgi:hypothetical protein